MCSANVTDTQYTELLFTDSIVEDDCHSVEPHGSERNYGGKIVLNSPSSMKLSPTIFSLMNRTSGF